MPKKWKDVLDEDLTKAKSQEEKADILIDAHDAMSELTQKHEITADEINAARGRKIG